MKFKKLTEAEEKLAVVIWEREPINSTELIKQCEKTLLWNKSTTYTLLRRIEKKGIAINKDGVVSSIISEEEYRDKKSTEFLDETFGGSLPKFLATFIRNRKITEEEIDELQRIINAHREDD